MLEIKDLHVTAGDKNILNGFNLHVGPGEVHAIMGPNGSGKSTLAYVLAGREGYQIKQGAVLFQEHDLLTMKPEERSIAGLFLAFQYPVEIPGVTTMNFLKTALNAQRKGRGLPEIDAVGILKILREKSKSLGMSEDMLKRAVNVGFSGGEKKRNDILQMAVLEPLLSILDETDSGLDIDALKAVAEGINAQRGPNRSMVVITHYQRLLDYVKPDFVHIMAKGRIVRSGGFALAQELEARGYGEFVSDEAA